MLYKNRFIRVQRERENKMINFDTGTPWETVTLSTIGTSRQLFVDMLQEAREFGLEGSEGEPSRCFLVVFILGLEIDVLIPLRFFHNLKA